jgi:rhomboid family GlyGly-CTERM serine protease
MQGIWTRIPWLTLALAGSMAALYAVLGPVPAGLVYDRDAIGEGDWWRLFSGHLVHGDVAHLAWNLGGLLVLGTLLERVSRPLLPVMLLGGAVTVDVALTLWLPGIAYYCGLSGVLNALLVPVLADAWRKSRSPLVPAIALLSLAKIGFETLAGQALVTDTLWPGVPLAHLAGWIAGVPALLLPGDRSRLRNTLPCGAACAPSAMPAGRVRAAG